MPVNVAALEATLDADVRGFTRGMNKADRELDGFQRNTKQASGNVNNSLGKVGKVAKAALGAVAVGEMVRFGKRAFDMAASAKESVNAVEVVFGDAADSILDFSETSVDSIGLAERKVNQAATVLGSSLQAAGLEADEAADQTINLTKRAADMASVFNTDVDSSLQAIQAAIRGEIDPIEKFGVSMNAASVEAFAMAEGLHDGTGEMTNQEKVLARLGVIMDQTERVAGDYANTSDSAANASKRFGERLDAVMVAIGEELIPTAEKLLPVLEGIAIGAAGAATHISDFFTAVSKAPVIEDVIFGVRAAKRTQDLIGSLTDTEQIAHELQRTIGDDYVDSLKAMAREAERSEDATRGLGRAADLTEDDIKGLTSAVDRLVGKEVDATEAALNFEQSVADLAAQLGETGTSLDIATEKGRQNQQAVLDSVKATKDLIGASVEEAATVGAARDAVAGHVEQLRKSMKQAGFTEQEVSKLVAQYNLVPDQLVTDMFADVEPALRELARLRSALRDIGAATGANIATVTVGGTQGGLVATAHEGGIVPGPPGAEVPIIAQAGEQIIPLGSDGSRQMVFNFNAPVLGTPEEIKRMVQQAIRQEERRSGRSRL